MSFPRTTIDGVSVSRMIIGSNWMLGYSHTGAAADYHINDINGKPEAVADICSAYLEAGVDTIMAPMFAGDPKTGVLQRGMQMAEDRTGKGLIRIATPVMPMDDNEAARKEAENIIKETKKLGSVFCFPHHSSAEQLVNKNKGTMDRLPDYLSMIRDNGMIPGLSAHMPELIVYSDANEYDVQTYVQIWNCLGFLMQVEVEYIHNVIWNAKKPVMTIKSMAAGRVSPFVGITFSYATIRPIDMVTIGAFTPQEAREDIEIALAAIERRRPDLEGRASPNKTAIMQ